MEMVKPNGSNSDHKYFLCSHGAAGKAEQSGQILEKYLPDGPEVPQPKIRRRR